MATTASPTPTTAQLATKTGVGSYGYNDSSHKHAVTHLDGNQKYWYDANGNMTTRVAGSSYTLQYDAESRLVSVSGGISASFVFDGDGNRVKSTVAGVTTTFIGGYYEWTSSGNTLYYSAGGARVAMRRSGYTRPAFTGCSFSWLPHVSVT